MAKQKNTPTTSNQIEPKSCFWDSNEDSKSKPHKLPLQTPNYERFWWFICACWPPPLRWPHEASTAVHETADHCSCPKQGPNLDTVMIHDNLKKQTSKAFLKCSFHALQTSCLRQATWLLGSSLGDSELMGAQLWRCIENLFSKEITHFFYSPRRTTTCQNISGRSTKRVFFVTWPRENRPSHPSAIEFINLGADSCVPSKLKRL